MTTVNERREFFYLHHAQNSDTFSEYLPSVLLESVSSHSDLCVRASVCVCVCVCVCLGLAVIAAGREKKQRTMTLNSCSNSNLSLTETVWKAKESISIPTTTIPKYIRHKRFHTHASACVTVTKTPIAADRNPLAYRSLKNNSTNYHFRVRNISAAPLYIFYVMHGNTRAHVLQLSVLLLVGGPHYVEMINTTNMK